MKRKYFIKRCSGSRRKIGYELGRFYSQAGLAWFRPAGGIDHIGKKQIDYAQKQVELVEKYHPALLDEIRGLSEGLGISYEQGLAIVLTSGMGREMGCTTFSLKGDDGDIYVGRNFAFASEISANSIYLGRFTSPIDGYATFGGTEALLGYTDGVNQHGLAVSMAMVPLDSCDQTLLPTAPPQGILFSVAIRTALETCRTTADAVDFLTEIPHIESFNFLVADRSGEMAIVEASPWKCNVRKEKKIAVATNFFSSPNMKELQETRWPLAMRQARYAFNGMRRRAVENALRLVHESKGRIERDSIFAMLRMVAFDSTQGEGTHTFWSECFDLTTGEIWWCAGSPVKGEFKMIGSLR